MAGGQLRGKKTNSLATLKEELWRKCMTCMQLIEVKRIESSFCNLPQVKVQNEDLR